jgi:hypothetical protein
MMSTITEVNGEADEQPNGQTEPVFRR